MSMNIVALTGRLGADPETKYFDSGSVKVRISLAVDKYIKGEKATHWFDVEAWAKNAETLASYAKKGDAIGISGSLETNTYSKDGQNIKRTFIHADRIELLSPPPNGGKETTSSDTEEPDF